MGCSTALGDLVKRNEQKLVDTLITADLIYLASRHPDVIVIVSSDDDMWPGIRSALALGASVVHIQTQVGRVIPVSYNPAVGSSYQQLSIV